MRFKFKLVARDPIYRIFLSDVWQRVEVQPRGPNGYREQNFANIHMYADYSI